jgi:hypothetical protein
MNTSLNVEIMNQTENQEIKEAFEKAKDRRKI